MTWIAVWAVLTALQPYDEPLSDYAGASLAVCPGVVADADERLALLRAEVAEAVPRKWRGMILAAACNESRFNPQARGDRNRDGTLYQAAGLTQLHRWHRRACGMDSRRWLPMAGDAPKAFDAVANARCWLSRVRRAAQGKLRQCRHPWRAAWAWIAKGGAGGCLAASRSHLCRLCQIRAYLCRSLPQRYAESCDSWERDCSCSRRRRPSFRAPESETCHSR